VINDGDHGAPKAYLNVIVFDKDFKADLSKSLKVAITGDGKYKPGSNHYGTHEQVALPDAIAIAEPGYLFVYVSNETPQSEVYFDDLQIAHTTTPIVQKDDYYPFGLSFNSSERSGFTTNKYLYNGKELQNELGLDWYHYGARFYDPAIAKWNQIDPMSDVYSSWSPYNYTLNNPIKNVDPDGKIVGTVVGAVVGGIAGAVDAYVNEKDFASSIAEGATAGAVAGAVVDLTIATGGGAAVVFGAAVAGGALGGAVGDIVGQTTDNVLSNNQSIGEALGNVDASQVGDKALKGAVSGVVGGALGVGTGKLLQGAANASKAGIASVGESIESTAKGVMQQGVTKMTTNGVTTYSQAPGLAGKVQGVMDNMVNGMGQSAKAAANGMIVADAVATGATESVTKAAPTQSTADYIKKTVSDWFD
jgi:RHS repeat-associated protein